MTKPLIAPSLMCIDVLRVSQELPVMDQAFDLYHVDVMDSHFCPNMALTPAFANSLRKASSIPMDVHLMVENPTLFTEMFQLGEQDCLSFQAETIERNAFRLIKRVREKGNQFGVVLSPATPLATTAAYLDQVDILTIMTVDTGFAGQTFIPAMLDKIAEARSVRAERGLNFKIQIDGQVNMSTYKTLYEAGADILVVGNSGLFDLKPTLPEAISEFHRQLEDETGVAL
ncbi:ribulose-phosphate 3-epimerase [Collinsella sp. AGMB00827]|uniref:Ribulose-phosphate 3-epimerase n=1 Tax=Collinsella ureilytica TaxID=2869515 RepID=A0ABS7MJC7_9ACTN|nr:ribulose-phosphate 3-epimerase [Collinsella urealyticum]